MLQTYYEFCGDHLIIRCRLFSLYKVHIDDIKTAEPTWTVVASIVLSLCQWPSTPRAIAALWFRTATKQSLNSYPKKGPRGPKLP